MICYAINRLPINVPADIGLSELEDNHMILFDYKGALGLLHEAVRQDLIRQLKERDEHLKQYREHPPLYVDFDHLTPVSRVKLN